MTWLEATKLLISVIQAISFVATASVAYIIFRMQRKDAKQAAKREARAPLTEAYQKFNAEVIRSRNNIVVMRELIYPMYDESQIERIEFMYLLLNTLYLEWHYYKDHVHAKDEFKRTLESLMKPIAKNIRSTSNRNEFLINEFGKIFLEFPEDFKKTVLDCIGRPGR